MDPEETARRSGSDRHLAGLFEPSAAILQPALLARGLRRVALGLGVRLHEGTRVTRLDRRSPAVLHTPLGVLTAERVVIATNTWAVGLRELHTRLAIISSDIVATAPIDRLREIGWTQHECISDSRLQISYYRTTDDGRDRVRQGRLGHRAERPHRRALRPRRRPRPRRHPQPARDLPHARRRANRDRLVRAHRPHAHRFFGHLGGRSHIVYGVGFSGNGVAPAVLGGRILSALALDIADEWSACGLVDGKQGRFPPIPCAPGAHIVREGVARKEEAEMEGRRPNPWPSHWHASPPPG